MTRAELRELLAASHKVSQRWVCGAPRRDGTCQVYAPNRGPLRVIVPIAETEPANGALIVAAVNALPRLLDKLDAVEALLVSAVEIAIHSHEEGQHVDMVREALAALRKEDG